MFIFIESMILYLYDNKIESGQIANGNSTGSPINDLLWDVGDNHLKPINGSFYVKVNAELYSKLFYKTSWKMYNYPGVYYLKCYYDTQPSNFVVKKVTITDCKLFFIIFIIRLLKLLV
jgi:hypothetical protein